ncbi:MAG: DUF4349 domain-containing protein [Lachnospiraceae bacterium]|nr:DUF4349 domain-containing protein [Lachnospiraceae bacterium]
MKNRTEKGRDYYTKAGEMNMRSLSNMQSGGRMIGRKIVGRFLSAVMLLTLCVGMTGCGSGDKGSNVTYADENYGQAAAEDTAASMDYDSIDEEFAYEDMQSAEVEGSADYGLNGAVSGKTADMAEKGTDITSAAGNGTDGDTALKRDNKKIIKRYNYRYETEHFDEAYAFLKNRIEEYSGYISSSSTSGTSYRTLYLTARIPADVSDAFVEQLGSLGTILSQSESADDVTLQYTDTESRIKALKTEQERLNDLLERADSLETIIALEDRLTEVRYELENYQSQKNLYDDLISYSTVDITLSEVSHTIEVEDSFLARISAGLHTTCWDIRDGFTDFVVWLIVELPYLVIWGIIIFVIIKIIGAVRRRRKAKRERKQELALEADKLEADDVEREEIPNAPKETNSEEDKEQKEE